MKFPKVKLRQYLSIALVILILIHTYLWIGGHADCYVSNGVGYGYTLDTDHPVDVLYKHHIKWVVMQGNMSLGFPTRIQTSSATETS